MGCLLWLITNYCLIFLWKAHMAAIKATPSPFQYGKSLLKSKKKKTHILFRKKNIEILHGVLKQRLNYDMLLNCILDKNLQTNSKWRQFQTIIKHHVTKHFKMMMFLNCCVQMHAYSQSDIFNLIQIRYLNRL